MLDGSGSLRPSTHPERRLLFFKETHGAHIEAIQLFAESLGMKTVELQYTNTSLPNFNISSGADKHLVFSREYAERYQNSLAPQSEVIEVGYLYDHMVESNRPYAEAVRNELKGKGAKFVLGYFDEKVQDDKFSFFDTKYFFGHMELLARMVIEHEWFAVVMKRQFLAGVDGMDLTGVAMVERAIETGRFIELESGYFRNNVLPMQVALCSDLVVGELLGGTAILEAAVAGCPAVALGNSSSYHEMISNHNAHIIVDSLEALLDGIALSSGDHSALLERFDWSGGLHNFTGANRGNADKLIQQSLMGSA